MTTPKMTPLAAVIGGAVAGAVSTLAMDPGLVPAAPPSRRKGGFLPVGVLHRRLQLRGGGSTRQGGTETRRGSVPDRAAS